MWVFFRLSARSGVTSDHGELGVLVGIVAIPIVCNPAQLFTGLCNEVSVKGDFSAMGHRGSV